LARGTSSKRISGTAYQALRKALALVYWYKSTLETYLRAALREHPELLSNLDFRGKKRQIADELIDRLIEHEARYRNATINLMIELANMTTFPELEQHEDSAKWLPMAKDAVRELKQQTEGYEQLATERERLVAEQAANAAQARLQSRFADELEDLRQNFLSMTGMADPNERGRQFEDFLNSLFALFDLDPRLSYSLETEQIDGSLSFDTDDYILEAKWTKNPLSREQADAFHMKVQRRGKNALGLIISINGISQAVKSAYGNGTSFMTMDASDLICVLEGRAKLDDILRRKKRHANETGECYFPVGQMY
jgi:hypothetical protein